MRSYIPLCAVLVLLFAAGTASAQVNRCAECHFANISSVPGAPALLDWQRSAHAKHGVACDSCHGGDPTTYHPVDAHRGVLGSHDPLSTVASVNLELTCASCHSGVVASYRLSTHAGTFGTDQKRRPTCETCHGGMAARVPSPARFDVTCDPCHRATLARADSPALARQRIEALGGIERTLAALEATIASIEDRPRRNRLTAELLLARAAARNAADAFHTFDFRVIDEQRGVAQRRTSDLVADLTMRRR